MSQSLLQNTLNTRDLGGYPLKSNKFTKYGQFIRSDVPSNLSVQEIQQLLDLQITTIIDLRCSEEISKVPCALKDKEGFHYFHCNLYGNGGMPSSEEEVYLGYFNMIQEHHSIYSIMKLLTHAQNGVLYHCTAGKDRTGVISALLLSLVGVSSHDIISNYEISYSNLKPMIEKLHTQNPNLPPFIGHSKAVYMKMFLDLFYNRYCSPETYLTKIGLTKEEITTLKGKLVDF